MGFDDLCSGIAIGCRRVTSSGDIFVAATAAEGRLGSPMGSGGRMGFRGHAGSADPARQGSCDRMGSTDPIVHSRRAPATPWLPATPLVLTTHHVHGRPIGSGDLVACRRPLVLAAS